MGVVANCTAFRPTLLTQSIEPDWATFTYFDTVCVEHTPFFTFSVYYTAERTGTIVVATKVDNKTKQESLF